MSLQHENQNIVKCRENLYLGNFQAINNRLTSDEITKGTGFDQNEVKILLIRAYLSQNKFNSANTEASKMEQNDLAKAAKNLITLSQKIHSGIVQPIISDNEILKIVENTQQLIENKLNFTKPTFIVLVGLIFLHVGNYEQAMNLFALHPQNIEWLV
ncbi:hypothetical protein BB561_005233 [Smittium simulii]|uniref:Coatomer subunit epsilon n=1 Tax=Smittium simulii TaxID=133385 RepID=A0A2T9YBC6_9FUNG|nr:hypothetical protein BB561_005233 [Smittium simulii]